MNMKCGNWKHTNYSLIVSLFTSVLAFAVLVLLVYVMHLPCCENHLPAEEEGEHILQRNKGQFRNPESQSIWHEEKKRRKGGFRVRSPDSDEMNPLIAGSLNAHEQKNEDLLKRIPDFSRLSNPILQRSLRDFLKDDDTKSANDPDRDDSRDGWSDHVPVEIEATQSLSSHPQTWLDISMLPECKDSICSEHLSTPSKFRFHSCIHLVRKKNATVQDGKCHFVDRADREPVALVSFPGSGNTWVRSLMETTTGICTGAVYCDISLRAHGFTGEFVREASTLVVKTHETEPHWLGIKHYHLKSNEGAFGSAIFLVRNPFSALVAEWNRKVANNFHIRTVSFDTHVKNAGKDWFGNNTKWESFVLEQAERWQLMIRNWIIDNNYSHHPVLVVKYEELKESTLPEVKRMLDFLQIRYNDDILEERLNNHTYNHFHRNHKSEKFVHYTSKQARFVNAIIEDTIHLLKEHNLEQLIDMNSYYN